MNANTVHASPPAGLAASALERAVQAVRVAPGTREAQAAPRVEPVQQDALHRELAAVLERIAAKDTHLSFELDEESGHTVIYVRESGSAEVVRQIPSEEMLHVARRLEAHLDAAAGAAGVLLSGEA